MIVILPCPDCLGFFKGDELWHHNRCCQHKTSEPKRKPRLLLPTFSISTVDVDKELVLSVLSVVENNSISSMARHEQVIPQFGTANKEKVGRNNTNYVSQTKEERKNANYVSQRMHQPARLLVILCARSHEKEAALETYIYTSKFDDPFYFFIFVLFFLIVQ